MIILLDTETTGLVSNKALPLDQQPYVIELAALKLDHATLETIDELTFMCKPPIPLPPIITKITGIKDADLQNEKPFASHYLELVDFFIGARMLVAHNLAFDRDMLYLDLKRIDKVLNFPWPWRHYCTAEETMDLNKGKYFKQEQLYEHVTGNSANQTHRALDDVNQLREIVLWLRKEGRI